MFQFRQFEIDDSMTAMKVGTDGVLLGAWAFESHSPHHILDIGTGTGIVALMLAQRFGNTHITAIEIDPEAARQARLNVEHSPWKDRIEVINIDILEFDPPEPFDAIVSNPPFFNQPLQSPDIRRATSRHESNLTLERLINKAGDMLTDDGIFAFIAPSERLDELTYKTAVARIDLERITHVAPNDLSTPIRILLQGRKGLARTYRTDRLDIRSGNRYTSAYQTLTGDFYLDKTFK